MESARPVICAVDKSDASRHVAAAATWFARELDAPLLLAHVFDRDGIAVPPTRDMAAASITTEDIERTAR